MAISKVYRGEGDIKEFRFRSFGDADGMAPLETHPFETPGVAESVPPTTPRAASEAPNNVPQLLEEAYARGRQEGLAQAEERFDATSNALAQVLEDATRLRESLAQNSTRDMLRLVIAVAEQIVRRHIEIDPNVVASIVENALQASVRADSYRIRINPDDLQVVKDRKPLFLTSISGLKNLSIDADAAISRGGCRIDSELGDVDATIESQLDAIRQALTEAIAEG